MYLRWSASWGSFWGVRLYAREDDSLREPFLGEGQALRELVRRPLVHGRLPHPATQQLRRPEARMRGFSGSRRVYAVQRRGGSASGSTAEVNVSPAGREYQNGPALAERRATGEKSRRQRQVNGGMISRGVGGRRATSSPSAPERAGQCEGRVVVGG